MTSPESVGGTFNDGLRRSIVPAMTAQQASNTALFGNRLGLDGCSPNYHNIFGSINSYDQAMTQIGQNIQSTQNTNQNAVEESSVTTPSRNFAQEEKDEELMKNISNYNNLLE